MDKNTDSQKARQSNWTQQISMKYPWISILLVVVLGGLIGYLSGFFLPPIYEAKAVLTTNIDLKEDRPIITEIMVDSQLNYVGELMFNPKIIDPLLSQEANSGNPLTLEDVKSSASIERQLMNTIVKVRDNDPVIAARIATNWAKIAFETLLEAKSHVLAIVEAKQQLALIETCFPTNPDNAADKPTIVTEKAFCEGLTFQSAEAKLEEATRVLAAEESKTLGLTPYINISQYIPASVPVTPISQNQGLMTLSGMVIGIVVGIIFVDMRRLKNR